MKKKGLMLILTVFLFLILPFKNVNALTWDLLDNDWDSLNGWGKFGVGTSEINPASHLHQINSGSNQIGRNKDIGSLPESGYTVEFRVNITSFGTEGIEVRGSGLSKNLYDGEHQIVFSIFADKIRMKNSTAEMPDHALNTTAGIFYVWRLVIDSDADYAEVYRDGGLVLNHTEGFYDFTASEGYVYEYGDARNGGTSEHYEDYLRIASGLHPPIISRFLTFYFNEGGILRVNNATKTNGTTTEYNNGTILELSSLPQNSSYVVLNFTWTGGNSSLNPYNYTVSSNMTIWLYFDSVEGKFSSGFVLAMVIFLFVGVILAVSVPVAKKYG